MGTTTSQPFRIWLRQQIDTKKAANPSYGVRTLARNMAKQYPEGATHKNVETCRRTLNKYLAGTNPSQPMREAVADALDVSREELPADDESEDDPLVEVERARKMLDRALLAFAVEKARVAS